MYITKKRKLLKFLISWKDTIYTELLTHQEIMDRHPLHKFLVHSHYSSYLFNSRFILLRHSYILFLSSFDKSRSLLYSLFKSDSSSL